MKNIEKKNKYIYIGPNRKLQVKNFLKLKVDIDHELKSYVESQFVIDQCSWSWIKFDVRTVKKKLKSMLS